MKIVTYNANSIRTRKEQMRDWMQREEPDVLCIQETKVRDEQFPGDFFKEAGYHAVYRGGLKGHSGVAILSREEPTNVRFGLDDEPHDEDRLVCAAIGDVTVVNTYVPQGRELDHEMYQYKIAWFGRMRAFCDKHLDPDKAVAWCGDINVARHPIDVHHPDRHTEHVCFHKDVRDAFEEALAWGFTDVYRELNPEGDVYSYYDYRAGKNAIERGVGWRIDYVLASRSLADKVQKSFIDLDARRAERPSDHTFLTAEFNL
jgi:exodeoxyribonuclease-3